MSAQNDTRKLIRVLRDQGAIVERGSDHWKVLSEGRLIQVLPTHGNREHPTLTRKIRANLRREGYEV